jgi:dihydrodipicolinate reductase
MITNICAGATGWIGKPLCDVIATANDLRLVGAVSRSYAGHNLLEVLSTAQLCD